MNKRSSLLFPMLKGLAAVAAAAVMVPSAFGDEPGKITVQVDQPGARIAKNFYGLMTEEINYSYEGGIYGELIQNRVFKNTPRRGGRGPATGAIPHWSVVNSDGAAGDISIDTNDPVNTTALTQSLKLVINSIGNGQRVGIANDGFWGIPAKPNATYQVSFWARGSDGFQGPLTVDIESADHSTVHATATVPSITDKWQRYQVTLKTGDLKPSASNVFVISAASQGTVNFNQVSLFPPVFKTRTGAALGERPTTGFRPDILELLDAMHPTFLRFPGGNYVEGSNFANRFDFKTTIGPWEQRPGHMSPWGYRSTDGMGLLEFLEWCEDLKMDPVLAVYDGLNLDQGRDVKTGDALKPLIQDALDEIEYVSGDASTTWGARRAKDGHPEPFKLTYVEIGNEDFLNNGRTTYSGPDGRFSLFYKAIKEKYHKLQLIATTNPNVQHDVIDDHYYMDFNGALNNAHLYDKRPRNGPKVFVGEWATRDNNPTPSFHCALTDAAFLTGLERNADLVVMSCYAPLFDNLNPGGQQWATDLIGYNTISSFGSPSYYVQKMFYNNKGDVVLPITVVPQIAPVPAPPPATMPTTGPGRRRRPQGPPPQTLFASSSRDDSTGDIILKVVNAVEKPQQIEISLLGVTKVGNTAQTEVLTGGLTEMNSLDNPTKISPLQGSIPASAKFVQEFAGNTVTVLRFSTK